MRLFTQLTQRLLTEKRVSGFFVQGNASPETNLEYNKFTEAFDHKTEPKAINRDLAWADWLVEGVFPVTLYQEHKGSLRDLVADPRCYEKIPKMSGYNSWNSSFGRMAKPRESMPEGFVIYLLDRWAGKYRSMPHYYFDAEEPEWVYAPLSGRPDVPKTGRTSVSCTMNYGFHWLDGRANMSVVLRHMQWSHAWGNVYGSYAALAAICKELGGLPLGNISIFANSASMDTPKVARKYLQLIGEE